MTIEPKPPEHDTEAAVEPSDQGAEAAPTAIVGVGASAGGLEAIEAFFQAMPTDSGMAFVVILHLSPEHDSNLTEIIQTQTAMPVEVVNKTKKVEPNRVYVIPPNRQLEMVEGIVRSTALVGERGERVAIDVFFRTLAERPPSFG